MPDVYDKFNELQEKRKSMSAELRRISAEIVELNARRRAMFGAVRRRLDADRAALLKRQEDLVSQKKLVQKFITNEYLRARELMEQKDYWPIFASVVKRHLPEEDYAELQRIAREEFIQHLGIEDESGL